MGLFIMLGISGCETDNSGSAGNSMAGLTGNIKTQGVYTTLTMPDSGLDMPASGYMQKTSFGPGEDPSAIVVGYGNYNQQQAVNLELIESGTGRSLLSQDYYASYGKAIIQPLTIRLSGNYELKLTSNETPLDSWSFTTTRTNSSGIVTVDAGTSGRNYAQGLFHTSIGTEHEPDFLADYNDKLSYAIVNSINEEAFSSTNRDLFAQRFPGKVVIQCHLNFQGKLTDPKILENSLDEDCGRIITNALLDRSPYDTWSQDIRQELGSDEREVTVTVYFD